jgi:L-asparaginase II
LRSAAKPFIAAAVVRSGATERFGFEPHEIALMAASHNGEPAQVAAAASMLAKIGASETDLACGVQTPSYPPAAAALADAGLRPTQLHHNCSGKHAGILALARMLGAPLAGYLEREHPAEQAVLALCERAFRERFTPDLLGVDGCGIPVFATPLANAAHTFARFATLGGFEPEDARALGIVRDAMLAHPWYVGGTDRFDTDLMEALPGQIVAKAGAEGVEGVALLDRGLGVTVKVIDGTRRAVPPATVAVLDRIGALSAEGRRAIDPHAVEPVYNVAGRIVGRIAARPL